MFGFKPKEKEQVSQKPRQPQQAPAQKPKPAPVDPKILGTGMAAKAGESLRDRRKKIDEAAGFADGGLVTGPGTGTSDDIETSVKDGTYIMPADSTQTIGEENLSGMGFNPGGVPVNLSNGEYELPPEQVHAIGVQTLDAMKDSTHIPVDVSGAKSPDMFFADGGEVRRRNTLYVDNEGRAMNSPNSSSRELAVRPGTGVATSGQGFTPGTPATTAQPRPAATNTDFYTNSRGDTARFMPSSSRDIVPSGQPAGQSTPGQSVQAAQAQQASAQQPTSQRGSRGFSVRGAGALAAIPALMAAAEDDSTQRYAERLGVSEPSGDGSFSDIAKFAGLRAAGFAGDIVEGASPQSILMPNISSQDSENLKSYFSDQGQQISDQWGRGDRAQAAGTAVRTALGGTVAAGDAYVRGLVGPVVDGARGFARGLFGSGDGQESVSESVSPSASGSGSRSPVSEASRSSGGQAVQANIPNNVIRNGNSYSATGPVTEGFTINGEEQSRGGFVGSLDIPASQQRPASGALAQAAGFAPGQGGGRVTFIPDSSSSNRTAEAAIRAASTPHRGAQNGQLTANQMNTLRSIAESDSSAQRDMAIAAMRENSANQRAEIGEAGANARSAATNSVAQQRLDSENYARGFEVRAAERMERLYQAYENAAPEQKSAIARQIQELSGRSGQTARDNLMLVGGGQEWDDVAGVMRNVPQRIFDAQSRQFVDGGAPSSRPPQNHVDELRRNPSLARQFDDQYGPGSSARYLNN